MEPVTIGILAATAASAIGQWLNSSSAAEASAAERKRVADLADKLQTPNFDFSTLNPQEYQVVQKYVPKAAAAINQVAPETIKMNSPEAQKASSAQMDVLKQMQDLARTGEDPISALANMKAQQQALTQNRSLQQNLDLESQRRGLAGSGVSMAGRMAANQAAARDISMSEQQAAADAANRRMGAGMNAAGLAGNIYGQQMSQEEKNAAIINQFNNALTDRRQQVEMANTGAQNQANQFNTGMAQDVANMNTNTANQFNVQNRARQDQLAQQQFQNNAQKVSLATGQGMANQQAIQNQAMQNNQAISGLGQGVTSALMYANSNKDPYNQNKPKQQQAGY